MCIDYIRGLMLQMLRWRVQHIWKRWPCLMNTIPMSSLQNEVIGLTGRVYWYFLFPFSLRNRLSLSLAVFLAAWLKKKALLQTGLLSSSNGRHPLQKQMYSIFTHCEGEVETIKESYSLPFIKHIIELDQIKQCTVCEKSAYKWTQCDTSDA